MQKTLLYKLFGIGGVPKRVRSSLEAEQIVMIDEGVGGSVTFRHYKAPGKWYLLRRVWFTGSLIVTKTRVAAFAYSRDVMNMTFGHPNFKRINVQVEPGSILCIALDARDFHPEHSGRIEFRFRTAKAKDFAGYFAGSA